LQGAIGNPRRCRRHLTDLFPGFGSATAGHPFAISVKQDSADETKLQAIALNTKHKSGLFRAVKIVDTTSIPTHHQARERRLTGRMVMPAARLQP
jgi:hypothetical protein